VATRLGPAQARIAMMLLLTLRGTPTLYQGDELGIEDVAVPPGRSLDPFAASGEGRGRDPQRAPMPWSARPGSGFSSGTSWLPLPPAGRPPGVDDQEIDAGSMLSLTRALLRLRRAEPCLTRGEWRAVSSAGGVLVYDRVLGERRCRVLLNLTHEAANCPHGLTGAQIALSSHPGRKEAPVESAVALAPDEGLVLVADHGDA
jgi:alpha-glucosidase